MDAAILFEADAFRLDGPKLMGRQAAGNGFLRAAVEAHAGCPIWGFSPYSNASAAFRQTVLELDPAGRTEWIGREDFARMGERGVLFRPDIVMAPGAELRLRAGAARYSLCGITHTLSGKPLAALAAMPHLPLAPWDALICTSRAALGVVEGMFEAGEAMMSWRVGQAVRPPRPQFPVIPLGVHTRDFEATAEDRVQARRLLGLADDEVAVLFAGRLTFHAKAHPYQMFEALEAAAGRTGQRLVLIQAGQFPNEPVAEVYRKSMADFCPSVRPIFVNGKDGDRYRSVWRAADLFMSLSDNLQETFGITPLEAMASGLPVLVSDWDGYRDTVRDGEDGFRIRTYAPEPGQSEAIAQAYETGAIDYDYMLFRTCVAVSMDAAMLVDRLSLLLGDADLRRRMGEAGRERVRTIYDWRHIYRRYQELWDELSAIRAREYAANPAYWDAAPRSAPAHRDPFLSFAGFPTATVGLETRVEAAPGGTAERYLFLENHGIFPHWKVAPDLVGMLFDRLAQGPATVAELAEASRTRPSAVVEVTARLVKMNLVRVV